MLEVLSLAVSFPAVVYTVLLGVVLVYWAFVMVGALHIGEGSDGLAEGLHAGGAVAGAAKGALEGAAKGALEGAAKGALEGATKGVLEGAAHAAGGPEGLHVDGGDGDFDLDADVAHPGIFAALLSTLRLRQIPATVSLSVWVTFSWLVSVIAMQIGSRLVEGGPGFAIRTAILIVSPLVALPLSSLVCVPLAKVLVQRKPQSKPQLIGMTCRIRTGKVTDKFGEALLEDGGAGLVVRVRTDGANNLKRGELALIVDFDPEQDSFLVEPMDSVLGEGKS